MKVRIEIDETLFEDEVVIRCRRLDEETQKIYQSLQEVKKETRSILFYHDNTEYYFPLDKIFFFETEEHGVRAHTQDQIYETQYRLYELEEMLPGTFMRVSKSTILNLQHIFSITKNLTAASVVQFSGTHKQVYVSRNYYKPLKSRLEEKR
jgi:DNA-binding LytR/AlgR family response regulator